MNPWQFDLENAFQADDLKINDGEIAPHVLPGDPGRGPIIRHEVVSAAIAAASELGYPYHVGITRSADTFYAGHSRPGSSFADYWQSWWEGHFDDPQRLNVAAAEMEASVIFVLARVWRLRAGGISVVMDNVRKVSGEEGVFDPESQVDHAEEHIERLARLGNEIVAQLHRADQARAGSD